MSAQRLASVMARPSTSARTPGRSRRPKHLVFAMIGVRDHRVTRLANVVGLKTKPAELGVAVERVVHQRNGAQQREFAHDREDARKRRLLHAAPVGRAEHGNPQTRQPARQLGQLLHSPGRDGLIDFPCRRREPRVRIACEIEPRVYRDAMPTDGYAGPVQVAVGLAVGGLYDLVHVDACRVGESGEFVCQRDVDIAVGGFRQLGELSGLGAAEIPYAIRAGQIRAFVEVQDGAIEGFRALAAARVDSADKLRIPAQVRKDRPAGHSLRAVAEHEIAAEAQARARRPTLAQADAAWCAPAAWSRR